MGRLGNGLLAIPIPHPHSLIAIERTMKILLVSTYGFDAGFPSRPEYLQARALARRGHHVVAYEYYAPRYPGQSVRHAWLPGQVAVHRCRMWGFFSPEVLLRLLLAERPDIVHIHHLRNLLGFQVVSMARWLGLPVVLTPHGLLHDNDLVADRDRPLEAPLRFDRLIMRPGQLARSLLRGAHPRRAVRNYLLHAPLRLVDGAVALSNHERKVLIQLGLPSKRITVLPNAVDLELFQRRGEAAKRRGGDDVTAPEAESVALRQRFIAASTIQNRMVLFIGQLIGRKGFDLLARAMPAVVREVPEAQFVFVSHYRRGEAELRRIVREGGVERQLQLLGAVDEAEKIALLHVADVVVAPSRYEGFGIPLIEAMAAGRPVITTDVPAGNEVVRHERTGLLVPYDDPAALAAAIVRVLRDQVLAGRLGENGRREVAARYAADVLAAQLEDWYDLVRLVYRSARSGDQATGV